MEFILCELDLAGSDMLDTYSPFTQKIHTALRLHGLQYTSRRERDPSAYKHINPRQQVPVLLADGTPVFDSTDILKFLEKHSTTSLVPEDPKLAAQAWLLEEFADTSLNAFVVASRWADDENWPRVRKEFFGTMPAPLRAIIPERLRKQVVGGLYARDTWRGGANTCRKRLFEVLENLELQAPETGFWLGDRPGVADVALYGQLQSLRTPLTPWYRDVVERQTNLTAYLDRVRHTAAARQARPTASMGVQLAAQFMATLC